MATATILTTKRKHSLTSQHAGSCSQSEAKGESSRRHSSLPSRTMLRLEGHGRISASAPQPLDDPTSRGQYEFHIESPVSKPCVQRPFVVLATNIALWISCLLYLSKNLAVHRSLGMAGVSPLPVFAIPVIEFLLSSKDLLLALNTVYPLILGFGQLEKQNYRLRGQAVPTVDICITCCGEAVDVILNTVRAALVLDYPTDRYRIMLLDDGQSPSLEEAIQKLSKSQEPKHSPPLYYRARSLASDAKSYYKSGNLQYGIDELAKLGQSEFLANLDCDMIPHPQWLRVMLPSLLLDDRVALASPPQNYYNVPELDPLGQQSDLDVSLSIFEPLNEICGAARCMGTGFVVRQRALAAIGGWPLINVGEDLLLSSSLSDAGWRTTYVPEKVQYGLGPGSMLSHVKQKLRWVDGAIAVHKRFGFYTPWSRTRMRLPQRVIFLLQALREYCPLFYFPASIALPLCLVTIARSGKIGVLATDSLHSAQHAFYWLYVISRINNYAMYGHIHSKCLSNLKNVDVWTSFYTSGRCLLSFLPYFTEKLTFSPSGSLVSCIAERDPENRKGWLHRLSDKFILFHLAHTILIAAPLFMALRSCFPTTGKEARLGRQPLPLLLGLPGPVIQLFRLAQGAFVPVRYMAFPPTVPNWQQLTVADQNGVRRPKPREQREQIRYVSRASVCEIVVLVLIAVFGP